MFVTRIPSSMLGNFTSVRLEGGIGTVTQGRVIAQAGSDRTCVAGYATGPGLPYTAGSVQPNYGGGNNDGFVTCVKDEQFPIFINGFE